MRRHTAPNQTACCRFVAACTAALLACAPHVGAQQSTADPDGRRLPLGSDSLAIFLVRGTDTTRTGAMRDELTRQRVGDREVVRRVYQSVDRVLGQRLDTLTDVFASLAPVSHRSRSTRTVENLDFANGQATGWIRLTNGDSSTVSASAAAAFNSSSLDLVVRASSLRDGWQATIPVFVASSRAVSPVQARVTGVEVLNGEPCWRVDADFLGTAVSFWIGQTSRALRQQVLQVRPGMQILFRRAPFSQPGRSAA